MEISRAGSFSPPSLFFSTLCFRGREAAGIQLAAPESLHAILMKVQTFEESWAHVHRTIYEKASLIKEWDGRKEPNSKSPFPQKLKKLLFNQRSHQSA